MTRYEMINILANSVYKNVRGDSHDFDTVLYDLEKAGMLPPDDGDGYFEWEEEE